MKQADREILSDYYGEKFRIYGHDTRSLGWIPGARKVRFSALTAISGLDGGSVLDVGCGFGDLYGFLTGKGIKINYTGLDLNRDFIEIARKAYPDGRFIVGDIDEMGAEEYDWAFAAGVFTLKISDNEAFVRRSLKKMFDVSRSGFAADFLSPGYGTDDTYWRCPPEKMLELCRSISKRVAVRCDYMADEYCVYVYKEQMADERNVYLS